MKMLSFKSWLEAMRGSRRRLFYVFAGMVLCAVFDSFFRLLPDGVSQAQLLGVLLTGAGVITSFTGQGQLEQYIVIGDVDTTNPLQGLYISVDGDTKIDIQTAVLVTAFFKLYNQWTGTVVGLMFKVATGRIEGNTTLRFTNAGATTPNIFTYSTTTDEPAPVLAQTINVNANSNYTFSNFTALLVINTNMSSFDMTWNDAKNSTQNMSVTEADALFSEYNTAEADGRLQTTVTIIDNSMQLYKSVKLNAGAGGSVTVCAVKLPDGYFQMALAKARK